MNLRQGALPVCLGSIVGVVLPAVSLVLSGCGLSQQEVDMLNHRFHTRDPVLVRATVDEMVKHKDRRFVAEAKRFLEQSRAIRHTPPLPRDAEAQLHGAIRVIMESSRDDAVRYALEQLERPASASLRIDRWVLVLAGKLDDSRVDTELRRLFTDSRTHYGVRRNIGDVLSGRQLGQAPATREQPVGQGKELALSDREKEAIGPTWAEALASMGQADGAERLSQKLLNETQRHRADSVIRILKRCDTDLCRGILWRSPLEAIFLYQPSQLLDLGQADAVHKRTSAGGDHNVRLVL